MLEDEGVLKIGQNLKFDWQVFAVRGVAIASYDDTMLMSYVVDAGRSDHGLDPLAQRYFNHQTIDFNEVDQDRQDARSRSTASTSTRRPTMPPRTPT